MFDLAENQVVEDEPEISKADMFLLVEPILGEKGYRLLNADFQGGQAHIFLAKRNGVQYVVKGGKKRPNESGWKTANAEVAIAKKYQTSKFLIRLAEVIRASGYHVTVWELSLIHI